MELLDICGVGLDDAGASKLFETLTKMQVAARRLLLSGNGLSDQAVVALSGYLWHSPEPLWELALADNNITSKAVEDLLRCLYNHPSHPPKLPGTGSTSFPLRLDVRNNLLTDQENLIRRVESAGGQGAVQLCSTSGDGPAPPPVEATPGRPLPYLWVFLPRFAEQRGAKGDRREKDKHCRKGEKKDKIKGGKDAKKGNHDKKDKGKEKKDKDKKGKEKEKDWFGRDKALKQVARSMDPKASGKSEKAEKRSASRRRRRSPHEKGAKKGSHRRSGSSSGKSSSVSDSDSCSSRSPSAGRSSRSPSRGGGKRGSASRSFSRRRPPGSRSRDGGVAGAKATKHGGASRSASRGKRRRRLPAHGQAGPPPGHAPPGVRPLWPP